MRSDSAVTTDLLHRAGTGDNQALTDLFARHQPRLRQMVRLRLDRRLQGRISPSEILREAYNDLTRRLPEYSRDRSLPFFLWLRSLAGQKLMDLHRQHLGAAWRTRARRFLSTGAPCRRRPRLPWPPISWAGSLPRVRRPSARRCRPGSRMSSMAWIPWIARS